MGTELFFYIKHGLASLKTGPTSNPPDRKQRLAGQMPLLRNMASTMLRLGAPLCLRQVISVVGAPQGRSIGSAISCDRLRSAHNRLQATYMNNMKQRTRKR